jgi:hypothetical protein
MWIVSPNPTVLVWRVSKPNWRRSYLIGLCSEALDRTNSDTLCLDQNVFRPYTLHLINVSYTVDHLGVTIVTFSFVIESNLSPYISCPMSSLLAEG